MNENSLDEGPLVDFGRATLEIKKDNEVNEQNHLPTVSTGSASNNTNDLPDAAPGTIPSSRTVPSIPFKRMDAHTFFSDRSEVVERALKDCSESLVKEDDGEVVGSWLLTEISLWDTEKERLLLLTKTALYTVKYDFISLKTLEYSRVPLSEIDTVVNGELVYPSGSLVPRRNMAGVRLMWNKGQPLAMDKKWNPFARNIPWLTYASHPLFWHKGTDTEKTRFDIEALHAALLSLLPEHCRVISNSIVLDNYLGLGALLHNRNSLGFFKIRGKVSF